MKVFTRGLLVAAALCAVPFATRGTSVQAQGPASSPNRMLVQMWHVKPDMLATFRELVSSQLIPAQKKAGLGYRWTFATGPIGGPGFTYMSLQPVPTYATLAQGPAGRRGMGDEAWNRYNDRLRQTLTGTEAFVYTLRPELSLTSGASTPPRYVEVTEWQALAGKAAEFRALTGAEYLPAWRKAGVTQQWVYVVDYGETPANHFLFIRGLADLGELDRPSILQQGGLSADAVAALNMRRGLLAEGSNRRVMDFVPEMSFGTLAASSTTH